MLPRTVKLENETPISALTANGELAAIVDQVSIHGQKKKSFCTENVGLDQIDVQALSVDIDPSRRRAHSCETSDWCLLRNGASFVNRA